MEEKDYNPHSKVHGANTGPIWGRQDLDRSHVGPMNFAIREFNPNLFKYSNVWYIKTFLKIKNKIQLYMYMYENIKSHVLIIHCLQLVCQQFYSN